MTHQSTSSALLELTGPQKRLVIESEPDDITGEEGCGIPIKGSGYRVARALERFGLGTYSHGSPYGDLYFNNAEGLRVRAALRSRATGAEE